MDKGERHEAILNKLDDIIGVAGEMCGFVDAEKRINLAKDLVDTMKRVRYLIYEEWEEEKTQ